MSKLTNDGRWLANKLHETAQAVKNLAKPQLGTSSIETGQISEYDAEGTLVSVVGEQHDGTHAAVTLAGPPPPEPAAPDVTPGDHLIEVRWSGKFADDAVSPMDFSHVSVHVSDLAIFTPDNTTQRATISGESGDVATILLDSGECSVVLVAVSRAGKWSDPSDPTTVVVLEPISPEEIVDEFIWVDTQIAETRTTANGKMTVSVLAPTPEDGVDKPLDALWNQIDPDTGAQLAVWRWTGTEWVDFPISETMLPLVNIAEGTYGRLQGVQLEADAINGMVITGAVIQSPGEGAGYQLTEDGYTSKDDAGNITVRFPSDGGPAQLRGDFEARSLTATGKVSLQAEENEIVPGASLVVSSGVSTPISPPSAALTFPSKNLPRTGSLEATKAVGLARSSDGLWWRASLYNGVNILLHGVNDSGAIVKTILTGLRDCYGVTAIGTKVFVLGHPQGSSIESIPYLVAFNTAGTELFRWQYAAYDFIAFKNSEAPNPALGNDGTNLVIAQCTKRVGSTWVITPFVKWNTYSANGSSAVISTTGTDFHTYEGLAGISIGPGDFGTTRAVITKASGTTEYFTADGSHIDKGGWFSANRRAVQGLTWHDGYFWHLQGDALIRNSKIYAPAGEGNGDTSDWWVSHSWTGPDGVETPAGPAYKFTFSRRSELQLSTGTPPPGVTGAKFYLAKKASTPTRLDGHYIATAAGSSSVIVATLAANWATTANPPATNTFPGGSQGLIKSRVGNFLARGDGSGTWGAFTISVSGVTSATALTVEDLTVPTINGEPIQEMYSNLDSVATGTNLNNLRQGGPYFLGNAAAGAANSNAPGNLGGMLEVFTNFSYTFQRYTVYTNAWTMYTRTRQASGAWNAWKAYTAS